MFLFDFTMHPIGTLTSSFEKLCTFKHKCRELKQSRGCSRCEWTRMMTIEKLCTLKNKCQVLK